MIAEESRERLSKRYPKYSSAQLEAADAFYRGFDPRFFLRIASQFRVAPYQTDPAGEGRDLLPDNVEKFSSTKASFLRYVRYLSSESLILLILSGYPFGPPPKTMTELTQNKLNEVLSDISARRVPIDFAMTVQGANLSFEDWFRSICFWDSKIDQDYCREFEAFIVREAGLLSNRNVINAFKHGRTQAPISGQGFQIFIDGDAGEKTPLLQEMEGAVHWLGWKEKNSNQKVSQSLVFGFEETNADKDYEIICGASALKCLLVDVRKGALEGSDEIEVFLPDVHNGSIQAPPQRLEIKHTTNWHRHRRQSEEETRS